MSEESVQRGGGNERETLSMHLRIKTITEIRKITTSLLKDADGTPLMHTLQKLKRWTEYEKELFRDNRKDNIGPYFENGLIMLKEEIKYIVKNTNNKRANGWMEL